MTRDQLPEQPRRVLDAVRRLEPPDDLFDTVMGEVERTQQARRPGLAALRLTLGTALAAGVVVLAIIAIPRTDEPAATRSTDPSLPIHSTPREIAALPVVGAVETRIPIPSGAYPGGADDNSVWLGSPSTGDVIRVDSRTAEMMATIHVNEPMTAPYDLWPVSDGTSVWVAGFEDRSLVRIDIASMAVADRWPIRAVPYRIVPADDAVWVSDFDDSEVLRIDAATGEATLVVQVRRPTGIAVTPDAIWVVTYLGELIRVNPTTGQLEGTYRIAGNATDIHVRAGSLWITGIHNRRLERFDLALGTVAAWTDGVTAVAFVNDQPWAAVTRGAVVQLDPITLEWQAAVGIPGVELDQMVAANGRLWAVGVAEGESVLHVIRPR